MMMNCNTGIDCSECPGCEVGMIDMLLSEFFDVNAITHIKAFKFLSQYGHWPEDFVNNLPENVKLDAIEVVKIQAMMGMAWVDLMLETHKND